MTVSDFNAKFVIGSPSWYRATKQQGRSKSDAKYAILFITVVNKYQYSIHCQSGFLVRHAHMLNNITEYSITTLGKPSKKNVDFEDIALIRDYLPTLGLNNLRHISQF